MKTLSLDLTRRSFATALGVASIAGETSAKPHRLGGKLDVIVLGAGLSGLHAARLLEARGFRVLVLDALDRVGGRMNTLFGLPGAPESGGAQVGRAYKRVRATIASLKVGVHDFPPENPADLALSFAKRVYSPAQWKDAPENSFPPNLKSLLPSGILFRLAAENPFTLDTDWVQASGMSDISAAAFLRSKGLDEESIRLVNVTLNANDANSYSMVNVYRTLQLFSRDAELGATQTVAGGSNRLAQAMAASLSRPVELKKIVSEITMNKSGAIVKCADNSQYAASFVLSTLPFPAFRTVAVNAPLSALQREAISKMAYTQIVQVHLEASKPFWETDGLASSIWTDSPMERAWVQRDRLSGQPTGMLMSWINGNGADTVSALSDEALGDVCVAEWARLRPASAGNVRSRKVVRWTRNNALAGGAYMHFSPGQAARWAPHLGKPAGRLHLAGEHLSIASTGMEGAMESAEAAVNGIVGATQAKQ